jgi:hypothetical protein
VESVTTDSALQNTLIKLLLSAELFGQLDRIAKSSGLRDVTEAAMVGLTEWASSRVAELDNRDPVQKYFINEALEQLFARRK